jgi:hypothetical protein
LQSQLADLNAIAANDVVKRLLDYEIIPPKALDFCVWQFCETSAMVLARGSAPTLVVHD